VEKEKKLLKFYKKIVKLSQMDLASGTIFFEQAIISMIAGYEFAVRMLCSEKAYEKLLLWNLTYNEQKRDFGDIQSLLGPFSLINQTKYYTDLLAKDFILNKALLQICRLTKDLEEKENPYLRALLKSKKHDLTFIYCSIAQLKEIIRKGWVKRNVPKEYLENDSIHSMQMFAFASAYFRYYESVDFNVKKVLEMILIHEIGEILADDIVEGDPNHDAKYDIEFRAVKNTFEHLECGNYLISLWKEFEQRETPEARFTYELDKLDPILKAKYLDDELKRNDLFKDFYEYEKNRETFEKSRLKKIFDCLEEK